DSSSTVVDSNTTTAILVNQNDISSQLQSDSNTTANPAETDAGKLSASGVSLLSVTDDAIGESSKSGVASPASAPRNTSIFEEEDSVETAVNKFKDQMKEVVRKKLEASGLKPIDRNNQGDKPSASGIALLSHSDNLSPTTAGLATATAAPGSIIEEQEESGLTSYTNYLAKKKKGSRKIIESSDEDEDSDDAADSKNNKKSPAKKRRLIATSDVESDDDNAVKQSSTSAKGKSKKRQTTGGRKK
ncbi:MAG: hypothetical protein ACRCXZ_10195, partial [Patescibacteria group bacterium]